MMIFSNLIGTGGFLPGEPVSNDDLIRQYKINSSDEWIQSRTGIAYRHLADSSKETNLDLAERASRNALESAGIDDANDIDLVIVATSTPDCIFPSVAAHLQERLGIKNGSAAFDIQAVCAGFVYALTIADKFIVSGACNRILVVGSEVFSRILDWRDRKTCVLFGDGAGAVVLERGGHPGILATQIHANGHLNDILKAPSYLKGGNVMGDPFVTMDGQTVFRHAVNVLSTVSEEVMLKANIGLDQLTWVVPHQANIRIIAGVSKKLNVPMSHFVQTVKTHGNTSAASIPLALDHLMKSQKMTKNDHILLAAVGGGLTWGGTLFIPSIKN